MAKPEGRNHLGDPRIDGTIILKWNFETLDGGRGGTQTGSI
jgi:hypothetical protein